LPLAHVGFRTPDHPPRTLVVIPTALFRLLTSQLSGFVNSFTFHTHLPPDSRFACSAVIPCRAQTASDPAGLRCI
jgi:hypothetical protein